MAKNPVVKKLSPTQLKALRGGRKCGSTRKHSHHSKSHRSHKSHRSDCGSRRRSECRRSTRRSHRSGGCR